MTIRIGIVSDTHLPRFGRVLPGPLVAGFHDERVELILHLGDFTAPFVPDLFAPIAPLDGVAGNNDGPELLERFGRRKVLPVGGVRIGLTHGDLGRGRTTRERAAKSFSAAEVDVVLFGHSHMPLVERLADGRWLINPGSPTDKRRESAFSCALLAVDAGAVVQADLRWFERR